MDVKCFRKGKMSFDEIYQWLKDLREHCYVPISGFTVTCVLRASYAGEDDYYFSGVNIENIDNLLSTHAEEGAIALMVNALGKDARIEELWLIGADGSVEECDRHVTSCGKCRQHIVESAVSENVKVHSVSLSGAIDTMTIDELLPKAFGFKKEARMTKANKSISVDDIKNRLVREGDLSDEEIFEWIKSLEAVDFISGASQMAILRLEGDVYVSGVRMESGAFLSIEAVRSAIITGVVEFKEPKIEAVYLYARIDGDKANIDDDEFMPISKAELQVIDEFASDDCLIQVFVGDGELISVDWSYIPYNTREMIYKVDFE